MKYFSGTATYRKTLDLPRDFVDGSDRVLLGLGNVKEVARVHVNGRDAGSLWKPPYELDISDLLKPGSNSLSIEVTNVWNNRIVGDQQRDDDLDITRTNIKRLFKAGSPLQPSGLMGPVSLRLQRPVVIELK